MVATLCQTPLGTEQSRGGGRKSKWSSELWTGSFHNPQIFNRLISLFLQKGNLLTFNVNLILLETIGLFMANSQFDTSAKSTRMPYYLCGPAVTKLWFDSDIQPVSLWDSWVSDAKTLFSLLSFPHRPTTTRHAANHAAMPRPKPSNNVAPVRYAPWLPLGIFCRRDSPLLPLFMAVQEIMVKGCVRAGIVHATFDKVYLDIRE